MKTTVFLGIGLRIIILFTIGMFMTYLPENLTEFFGDKMVTNTWGKSLEWGVRHYWYAIMMGLLFTLSLVNVVLSVIQLVNKNYDTSKW